MMNGILVTDQFVPTYSRWVDVPEGLKTKTQWRREDRRIRKGASAKAFFDSYYYGKTYELFSPTETEPIVRRAVKPPVILGFSDESLGSAIQTINDAAKRRRDSATNFYRRRWHNRAQDSSAEKAAFYDLKDSVLQRLLEQGRARIVGYHTKTDRFEPPKPRWRHWRFDDRVKPDDFEDEFDDEWVDDAFPEPTSDPGKPIPQHQTTVLEVVEFAGHLFHRPVETTPDEVQITNHLGEALSPSRPLGSLRLRDAEATLRTYLHQPRIVLPCEVVALGVPVPSGQLIAAVSIPWLAICREIQMNPRFLYQFVQHPRNFEEFIAACYDQAGFDEVILTPRSADRGRDVIAIKRGHFSLRFLDQCKAYSPNRVVCANNVRAMLGAITGDRNTSKGIITTTASFAPGIESDAFLSPFIPHRLELRDGVRLHEWLCGLGDGSIIDL